MLNAIKSLHTAVSSYVCINVFFMHNGSKSHQDYMLDRVAVYQHCCLIFLSMIQLWK